jgi:hypothetical protein
MSPATRNRQPKPLPNGAISLHAARSHKHTCPACGSRSVVCVTTCGNGTQMVKITFDCGETFTRPLKGVGG